MNGSHFAVSGSHLAVSGSCLQSLPNMTMRLYQKGSDDVHTSWTLLRPASRGSCAPVISYSFCCELYIRNYTVGAAKLLAVQQVLNKNFQGIRNDRRRKETRGDTDRTIILFLIPWCFSVRDKGTVL